MPRTSILDESLLDLTPIDRFTLRDAVQGVLATGGIGSGKTTAHATLARSYLKAGMGGLVCCAKPEEAQHWRDLCAQTGRSAHLVEFDGEGPGLNVIAWELARQGPDGLNSVVELLMRMVEIARNVGAQPGRSNEAFWEDTTRQLLRALVPLAHAANGTVRIADLLEIARSAPTSPTQFSEPAWQARSAFYRACVAARDKLDDATGERIMAYWERDFATLDPKTRGNILISLTTALDRFNHGMLRRAFCEDSAIVPELSFHGMVILLNMPALTRNEDGIIAQQLYKYVWQRAMLARNALPPEQRVRPVFLWADEVQYFLNPFDAEFLSTCRGSLVCVVFLSQSIPTLIVKMGGENARDRVHHLIGNFATRVWHNNACAETNEWASKTLGRTLQQRSSCNQSEGSNTSVGMNMGDGSNWGTNSSSGGNFSSSSGKGGSSSSSGSSWSSGNSEGGSDNRGRNRGHGSNSSTTHGYSEQMDHLVEPGAFGRMLKTGGPANRNRVSAIWYQAGRRFAASGGNALLVEFQQ